MSICTNPISFLSFSHSVRDSVEYVVKVGVYIEDIGLCVCGAGESEEPGMWVFGFQFNRREKRVRTRVDMVGSIEHQV